MSGWLRLTVRRIIAILLLVLDLGLEPGSGLSFVGISDSDDSEAVADLCRQDDFWWGRKCAAIELAKALAIEAADSKTEFRPSSDTQSASAEWPFDQATVQPDIRSTICIVGVPCELAPAEVGLPRFQGRALLRNSYIAQKRHIVLIT
jgi:hypothetical protein